MSTTETPPPVPPDMADDLLGELGVAPDTKNIRARLRDIGNRSSLVPLAILFGLNAVDELDRSAFGVLTPEIRDAFGLDLQGILTVVAIVSFLALGGQVLVGYYADRYRRTRMAIGGAAVWGVFSLLTGLAPAIAILVVARIGSSLGKAVNDPTHNSLLSDYYEPNDRVTVFFSHRVANNLGQLVGPVIAGFLAFYFGWRAPFILFAIPTALLVVAALRFLPEPGRGVHERRAAGGSEEVALIDDEPPTFSEAWRACNQIRSLRRIFFALPFLAGSLVGLGGLYSILYEDRFGLNEVERGFVFAGAEPIQAIAAVFIGIPLATKLFVKDPGLVLRLLGFVAIVIAGGLTLIAISPTLLLSIPAQMVISGAGAIITPAIYAVVATVLPPRARAMGFSIGALWAMPGALVLVLVGGISDSVGLTGGILVLVPVFLIGSFILASGGKFVASDIERVRQAALAQSQRLAGVDADHAPALLQCRGVDVSYDQTQVLFGVDVDIAEGEIVALLGTNGAGKSTLLNAVSGLVRPHGGTILLGGRDITTLPANETAALGVVMVPGGKGVFPTLTVEENLQLAGWLFQKDTDHLEAAIEEVLETFPRLRERYDQRAGDLSGGEQQMLTLGQAFIADPKLLMIDELSLGLAPVIVEQLLDIVREIHRRGTTIVLVEQSVNVACTVAERAVFMEKGEVRFDGPTRELLERPDVLRAVFLQGSASVGASDDSDGAANGASVRAAPKRAFVPECESCGTVHDPILQTLDIGVTFGGIRAVDAVSFEVREGEILGLIGPNGAGKTTVFDLVSGFLTSTRGRVVLGGEDVTRLGPDARAMRGLGRSFQDARLFPSMTVTENIAVALERHIRTRDPVAAAVSSPATRAAEREVTRRVEELIELMNLEAFADKFVSELSTGSRRVVDLACSMAQEPRVLLLDEPSSGIAQRETEALGPLLLRIRDTTGAALLVVEHDMPLITGISDRLLALELGRVIAEGTPDEVVNDPQVVESYLGGSEAVIHRSGTTDAASAPAVERRPSIGVDADPPNGNGAAPRDGNGTTNGNGNGTTNGNGSRPRRRRQPLEAKR